MGVMCKCVGGRWCGLMWEQGDDKIYGTIHIPYRSHDRPVIYYAMPEDGEEYVTYIYAYESQGDGFMWSVYTPGDAYPMPYQVHGGGDDGGTPVSPEPDPEPASSLT